MHFEIISKLPEKKVCNKFQIKSLGIVHFIASTIASILVLAVQLYKIQGKNITFELFLEKISHKYY